MSDIKELKDNELELVSGGGSGNIPSGGIIFNGYINIEAGYYYTKSTNFNDVIYVFHDASGLQYTEECFTVDQAAGTWSSVNKDYEHVYNVGPRFKIDYPYQLNVRP